MSELITLAQDWLPELVSDWVQIRKERSDELERIFNEFTNWEHLAERYIEPNCQPMNPADANEDEPLATWVTQVPVRDRINEFLSREFKKRDGRNTLFVLSDAGMGKSSLLIMLKISHLLRFWPSHLDFRLLKLGPDTLETLESIQDRRNTVLLLDALDEDPEAWGRFDGRIRDLLEVTQTFRQAIITCRTQFFPRGGKLPIEKVGRISVRGYVCQLLYLSFFSDAQVESYLQRLYPSRWRSWFGLDHPKIDAAKSVVLSMDSLRMRPMLLSYVDDLVDAGLTQWDDYAIYRALVHHWLLREEAKPGQSATRDQLLEACEAMAYFLHLMGTRALSPSALEDLKKDYPGVGDLDRFEFGGRSLLNLNSAGEYRFAHFSIQEFLVVHRLVESGKSSRSRLRVTDQILKFLLSWSRSRDSSKIPWGAFDLSTLGTEALGYLWGDELERILEGTGSQSLSDLEPGQRGEALLKLSKAPSPSLALLLIDLQRHQTRNGDDLYHLELAAESVGQRHPEHRKAVEELRGRFYDHIPAPPAGLFETVTTRDGVVDLWCEIPAGEYQLGNAKGERLGAGRHSLYKVTLEHSVRVAAVSVTQEQFRAFDPNHKSGYKGDDRPVEQVSWWAATAFCRWLANHPATAGARLPTEEEWEIACRAGTTTQYWSGESQDDLDRVGWYRENSNHQTHPVGLKPANPWGLYDVHGNVYEWTASPLSDPNESDHRNRVLSPTAAELASLTPRWPSSPKQLAESADSPPDPERARRVDRMFRGGSFLEGAWVARSASRYWFAPGTRIGDLGFRVLLPSAAPKP